MLCPKCGINVGEEQTSCPNCGTAMNQTPNPDIGAADPVQSESNGAPDAANQPSEAGQAESGGGWLTKAIGALVLLMIIAGLNAHVIVNNLMAHRGYGSVVMAVMVNLGILGSASKGGWIPIALVVLSMVVPGTMTGLNFREKVVARAACNAVSEMYSEALIEKSKKSHEDFSAVMDAIFRSAQCSKVKLISHPTKDYWTGVATMRDGRRVPIECRLSGKSIKVGIIGPSEASPKADDNPKQAPPPPFVGVADSFGGD